MAGLQFYKFGLNCFTSTTYKKQHILYFGQIQLLCLTGDQPFSDPSHNGDCSLSLSLFIYIYIYIYISLFLFLSVLHNVYSVCAQSHSFVDAFPLTLVTRRQWHLTSFCHFILLYMCKIKMTKSSLWLYWMQFTGYLKISFFLLRII